MVCALCGGPTYIIAFITDAAQAMKILEHIAVDTRAARICPAQELMAFTMNPVGLTMRLKERT